MQVWILFTQETKRNVQLFASELLVEFDVIG
jgi:hypothetical protein